MRIRRCEEPCSQFHCATQQLLRLELYRSGMLPAHSANFRANKTAQPAGVGCFLFSANKAVDRTSPAYSLPICMVSSIQIERGAPSTGSPLYVAVMRKPLSLTSAAY